VTSLDIVVAAVCALALANYLDCPVVFIVGASYHEKHRQQTEADENLHWEWQQRTADERIRALRQS